MVHLSASFRTALLLLCLVGAAGAHSLEREYEAAVEAGRKDRSRGIAAATEVLRLARERHDAAAEASSLTLISQHQRNLDRLDEALANAREAVRVAAGAGDAAVSCFAHYELGRCAAPAGLLAEAAESFQRAVALSEQLQDLTTAASAHTGLSSVYRRLDDTVRERSHRERALVLSEQLASPRMIGAASLNLGETVMRAGDQVRARTLLLSAVTLLKQHGDSLQYASSLDSLAQLEVLEGHYQEAKVLLDESVERFRPLKNLRHFTSVLTNRARTHRLLGRLDEALRDAQEAADYGDRVPDRDRRDAALRELATIQAARGDFVAAFEAERRARVERDAFNNELVQLRVTELQGRYDLQQQQAVIDRLSRERQLQAVQLQLSDSELSRTRRERLAAAIAAVLVGALLAVIVVLQRQRLRAERLAREQSEAARTAADEANRTKTRLLNFASHDLKAPLASLGLAARELEGAADRPAEVRELAGLMRAETLEMARLVHDFLDHSTIEAGRLELKFAPVDLADVAARVGAELLPLARAKEQTLTVLPPAQPLALVLGEAARLGQVIGNLLSNAIKFTPTGGRIEIASGQDAAGVWCEVRDNGPGIAAADLARLFQPYAKLGARPTGGESSSGLGLSLARELVALHGGVLQVESQPGQGATFRVVLAPAEPATTPDGAPPSAPATADR